MCTNCETLTKISYLACSTLITAGFIIQCILVHLVVIPYRLEANFQQARCRSLNTTRVHEAVKCENRCTRDRQTRFECRRVKVLIWTDKRNKTTGLIFDNIVTYINYGSVGCSTSSCYTKFTEFNLQDHWFFQKMNRKNTFKCFIHDTGDMNAILYKLYDDPLILFHSLFWPLSIVFFSGLALIIIWSRDRCIVWGTDNTVIS
ncbi:Calcium-activated potassium channel subunit beta-2 [Paragonimus heterotremus]|uniref:Calcium-activated potassium channel subunit beta-2 n=1 Tax=Paragonimus heterotremus TaxID=100268 RepID=A0A8J4WEE5_9TREM|nr:Calcium-activated potassium channel subunit beta-2 [Paragonimus heterotremus]